MMVDEKETTNGCGYDLNCSIWPKTEPNDNDNGGLLLDGSSGGVSFGDGTSSEGLRIYKRRKRRKMSNLEITKSEFDDKIKDVDDSAPDKDKQMLSFDAFTNGPGECSLRPCSNIVLQRMNQPLNGHEDGRGGYHQESGCMSVIKIKDADGSAPHQDKHILSFDAFNNGPGECSLRPCSNIILQQMHQPLNGHEDRSGGYHQESGRMSVIMKSLDNVERSDHQTNSSTPELSHHMSCELLKQSEGSTSSELCSGALSDILNSAKFSELCVLLKNFGVVNVNKVLDIDALSLKIKDGVYETSPILYLKDIQQVWTKLQQVGNEMVTLATSLSDKSRAHFEQFVRKPRAAEARGCKGCGEKVEVRNCLVCDSCEDIYHLSCSELVGTEIPHLNWYCTTCVSNGIGSPHDNCVVCEKLKAAASIPLVNGVPTTDQSQDVPNGSDEHLHGVTDENQTSNACFICKLEVKIADNFRTCGHILCPHKYYHYKCLNRKQLVVYGPCWYCPSCLCRRCLVDKDDDQIVLCDCCDEAYHIYCASPQLDSIPDGSWYCRKCDRELKRLRTMRRVYESMQKKVKIEEGSEKEEREEAMNEREGLDMLVNAAKTLSCRDTIWNMRSNTL